MRPLWTLIPILLFAAVGCDDDPSGPCDCPIESVWAEVDLGASIGDSAVLLAVDCAGGECLALGYSIQAVKRADALPGYSPLFYTLDPEAGWIPATLPGLPTENYFDLALDPAGRPVVMGYGVGGVSQPYTAIYDARTDPPSVFGRSSSAVTTVDGDAGFFVAGGSWGSGVLLSSDKPGTWDSDSFPKSGTNEGGFHAVDVLGDVAVACGFDDGADTLQVVLRRTKTDGWKLVNRDGLPFATELRCIAVDAAGAIFVGGVQSPGGPDTRAFASVRSASGEWTSLVLPDPVALGRVNDILLASDGSIYLACSSEYEDSSTAHLLRASEEGVREEIEPFGGELLQLAESADGSIYAAGSRRIDSGPNREPVLLRRAP
jgi:hypothetical protein